MTTQTTQTTQPAAFRSPLRDMTEALSDLVTVAEIAARTNKSQPNIHAMLNGKNAPGAIPGPSLGRRGSLYSWAEFEDFMARKAQKREESVQKKIDIAERAKARAEAAKAEAEAAKAALAQRKAEEEAAALAALVEEDAAEEVTEDVTPEDFEDQTELDLDLGEDFEDVEVEVDEEAMAAALADMADED